MENGGAVRNGEEDLRSYKRNLIMNKYLESYHFWLTLRLKWNVESGDFQREEEESEAIEAGNP